MITLQEAMTLAAEDSYLGVVPTTRLDGSVQASVVNVGAIAHPVTGEDVLAFVTYGRAKLRHLRARPRTAVTFRSGWRWATVEGWAELIGPDDAYRDVDGERLRLLLREIFVAAGGTHDDWDEYDRTMREQRRTAVLITPERLYGP